MIPTKRSRRLISRGAQPRSIGAIVGSFKSAATTRINELRGTRGNAVWQRNYYEHIPRNEAALERIQRYIAENPLRWEMDRENSTDWGRTTTSA